MNLGVTAEQGDLRDSVRRFLAERAPLARVRELMETTDGTDTGVWRQAGAQLGLQGIAIPEEYGGAGFSFAEQAIVLEELGAALYGGPYLASALLAATALLSSEDEGARRDLLPGIASGETIATLAFTEDDGSWDPESIRLAAANNGSGGGSAGTRASSSTGTARAWSSRSPRPAPARRPALPRQACRFSRSTAPRRAWPAPRCPPWTRPGSWPGANSTRCRGG